MLHVDFYHAAWLRRHRETLIGCYRQFLGRRRILWATRQARFCL